MEAADRHPEFGKLAEVIEKLGRLTGDAVDRWAEFTRTGGTGR